MSYEIRQQDKFRFIEEGDGRTADALTWAFWCIK